MRRKGTDKDRGAAPQSSAKKVGRDGVRRGRQADARKGSSVLISPSPELRAALEEEAIKGSIAGTAVVEVLSASPRDTILHVPWQRSPGVLIEGDELAAWSERIQRACGYLRLIPIRESTFGHVDCFVLLQSILGDLSEIGEHYRRSIRRHDERHAEAARLIRAREGRRKRKAAV